ncbi:BnaC01g31060D [Brassica napus]|uniref:(rape) hypothetical protein n=1 Tax=Brassica napus TaxID=3708 RepID=A0A078F381_BRANA|nr:unnamed protein product [Brassica napus]CDY08985.1 BnaC01g31060D [Brassica napus]
MQMDEMCLVMCGVWVCGSDGKLEFMVDKKKMARMVSVEEGISIKELERRVLVEFRAGELEYGVALSYWPPDSLELETRIKTPPCIANKRWVVEILF